MRMEKMLPTKPMPPTVKVSTPSHQYLVPRHADMYSAMFWGTHIQIMYRAEQKKRRLGYVKLLPGHGQVAVGLVLRKTKVLFCSSLCFIKLPAPDLANLCSAPLPNR